MDEVFFGLSWRPNPRIERWLGDFFVSRCAVLDVTDAIARMAGEFRGRLRSEGKVRSQADMLIAATARMHGLPLATRNLKDFEDCGLMLVDPFSGD